MIGFSVFRTVSQSGVCLAGRHGGGGEPTNGWQEKSAASGWAQMVGRMKQFCRPVASSCWRFQSRCQSIQRSDRHRHSDAAENSFEQA
jgi:hypothetical protein